MKKRWWYILAGCVVLFLALFLPVAGAEPRDAYTAIRSRAVSDGFRDISLDVRGDTLTVSAWPIGYRDPYQAYRELKESILKDENEGIGESINWVEIRLSSYGINTVAGVYNIDRPEKEQFSSGYGSIANRTNESPRNLIIFNLAYIASYGEPFDPFIVKTGITTDIRRRIGQSTYAYSRFNTYAVNEFDKNEWFEPLGLGIMTAHPLRPDIISVATIGMFANDVYGIDEDIRWSVFDERCEVRIHGGYYGELEFSDNRFWYRKPEYLLGLLGIAWYWDAYDTKLELNAGKYLYGDNGGGVTISRIFREVEFGVSGIKTNKDYTITIQAGIPLPGSSRASLAEHGIGIAPRYTHTYRHNNYNNQMWCTVPILPMSLDAMRGLAQPNHFRFMSARGYER